MNKEPIKSPFMDEPSDDDFFDELEKLQKKHGINSSFYVYSREMLDGLSSTYNARSDVISDGLLEYLKACIEFGRNELEEDVDNM